MGAIANILADRIAKRSGTSTPSQWLVDWVSGGGSTSSGINVTEESALKYTPFWAAVRIISGTVGALPFQTFRKVPEGKEKATEIPAYRLLHDRPNEYMDAVTFLETRQAHVLTYGNGYAEIQRDGAGRPVALWPLLPDATDRKITDSGILYYEVRLPDGSTAQLPDYNVLHIKGLGFDGYTGYNVVQYQKEAIGYGQAVKGYGSTFFSGGAHPGGVLEHPQPLSQTAKDNIVKAWEKRHGGGLSNKHRLQVLEEGMKWTKTGVDPMQAQALEVQKYNVDDCARIFNIPPHKLASMEHATFSNIEEQNIDFIACTMLYWFRKWEQECDYKLIMPSQHGTYYTQILVDALLRGNTQVRHAAYASGRQQGYYSINDIRRMENLNNIGPDGDIYLDPMNMKPAGSIDEPDDGSDDLRNALRKMIEAQFKRCIPKHNSGKLDYQWAEKILIDSVRAYAAAVNIMTEKRVQAALTESLIDVACPGKTLNETDAQLFSCRVIKLLGG